MHCLRGLWVFPLILITGCTSYGLVKNAPLEAAAAAKSYSLKAWERDPQQNEVGIVLAFSGGGTRAAALSYGVLKALRDSEVSIHGRNKRLLDEIDTITSVSGGSFTAAYYGLHGEKMFDDFETVFLKRDVEGALTSMLLNPINWFKSTGRTERSIEYYDQTIFHGATFADMNQKNRPLVVINASDLGNGVRFSFLQEYFSLLCSDIASFSVARAVAASSAVPILFNPVVVENYPGCESASKEWLHAMRRRAAGDERQTYLVDGLSTYLDKDKNTYAHFVDGGITDNLGLLAIFDIFEAAGGPSAYYRAVHRGLARFNVVVLVNASTAASTVMNKSTESPSVLETVNAMSDIQLHRYNVETIELMKESLAKWSKELSTPGDSLPYYFIQVSFTDLAPERRHFFDRIGTTFALSNEEVDALVAVGGELLRANPEFRRLLADIAR